MKRIRKGAAKSVAVGILILGLVVPQKTFASSSNEFFNTLIYGTLAGALVGTATLAFTSDPSGNLGNIARGASLGLYAGIILGLYLTYGVSDDPKPTGEIAPSAKWNVQPKVFHDPNPYAQNLSYGAGYSLRF